jgi:protein-tyrosine-phosphatase
MNDLVSGPYNVLFLCTGNSARSIIAEATLNAMAKGRFKAFSAGSHPSGKVNPLVLDFLREKGISNERARSKSWEEFSAPGAPRMHLIITVCDSAAGEACPIWPGHPVSAHWGVEDPALYMDDPAKAKEVIEDAFRVLRNRILLLMSLPVEKLDRLALQSKTRDIGQRQ